eukprot:34782_1
MHCLDTFDKIIRHFKVHMTMICDAQNSNPIHQCLKQIQLKSNKRFKIQSMDELERTMVQTSGELAHAVFSFLSHHEYDLDSINQDFEPRGSSFIMRQYPDIIYMQTIN